MSKKNKMVRYHEPPPFWGPKAKPKRKSSDTNDDDKVCFNKCLFKLNMFLYFYQI